MFHQNTQFTQIDNQLLQGTEAVRYIYIHIRIHVYIYIPLKKCTTVCLFFKDKTWRDNKLK